MNRTLSLIAFLFVSACALFIVLMAMSNAGAAR